MSSLLDVEGPVALQGAPDSLPDGREKSVQIMQLDMSKSVVDELLACIRNGKVPQVLFGRTPTLKIDGKKYALDATKERFRHEIYECNENHTDDWAFRGVVSHGLAVRETDNSQAGVDAALETLKQNMADYERDRAAKATTLADLPLKAKPSSRSRTGLLKAPSGTNRSLSSSPSLLGQSPTHLAPPTSTPKQDTKQQAIMQSLREPILHCLAIKPLTLLDIMRKTAVNSENWLQKLVVKVLEPIAQYSEETGTYRLKDRSYKELKPWSFRYNESDRTAAINNAVNAFDRMRVTKTDALWQKLLPKHERGKGKTLSKLAFTDGPTMTPAPTAKQPVAVDRKTGLPKKVAAPKADKESKAKASKEKEEDSSTDGPKKKKGETKAAAGANTPTTKGTKAGTKTSRASSNNTHRGTLGTVSKPKTSSPLSSPPMNTSDIETASKAKAAAKRKVESSSDTPQPSTKRSKLDVPSPAKKIASSASPTPASLKRKAEATTDATLKSRKLNGTHAPVRPHSSSASSSDRPLLQLHASAGGLAHKTTSVTPASVAVHSSNSSSSGDEAVPLSTRQTLELAQKFKAYHAKYAKLYRELAGRVTPPKAEERQQLEKMHKHLEAMKNEIWAGKLRG